MRDRLTILGTLTFLMFVMSSTSHALVCGPNGTQGPYLKLTLSESGEELGIMEDHGAYDLRNKLAFQWCSEGHCQQMGQFENYDVGNLSYWAFSLGLDGISKSYSIFLLSILGGAMAIELEGLLGTQLVMSSAWFKSIVAKLGLSSAQALWLSTWITPEGWATTTALYGVPLKIAIDKIQSATTQNPREDLYWDFFKDFNESDQMTLILKGEENSLSPTECSDIGFKNPEKFKHDIEHFLEAIDIVITENRVPERGEY